MITVVAPSIRISAPSLLLPYLSSAQFTATIRDADGIVLNDRVPVWTSNDTLAVLVTPAGVVSAVGRGRPTTTVTASSNGGQAAASVNVALTLSSLAAGMMHTTCGISRGGVAYCWGENSAGALGDGTQINRASPVVVATPSGVSFTSLSAGAGTTCGLTGGGQAFCWGANFDGQLGIGITANSPLPAPVAGGLVLATVDGGASFFCGRTTANVAYCWGYNNDGRLGDGSTMFKLTPVPVAGGRTFTQVVVGGTHACGLTPDGFAYCWGSNSHGQLGDGDPTVGSRLVPVLVR